MTAAQILTLKNDILANGNVSYNGNTISYYMSNTMYSIVAAFYNQNANPTVDLWRPDIDVSELAPNIVMTDFVGLQQNKRDGYMILITGSTLDATVANTRASFVEIFGATQTRTNLEAMSKRPATRFEALFTTSNVCERALYGYTVTSMDIENTTR